MRRLALLFLSVSFNTLAYHCPGQDFDQDLKILTKQESLLQTVEHLSCVESFNEQVMNGKHSYAFGVCESGKFNLSIKTFYPNAESAEEVFNNYFLNGDNVNSASSLLQTAPTINEKIKPTVAELLAKKAYVMKSSPVKDGKSSNLISNCSIATTDKIKKIEQTCTMDMSKGDGNQAFANTTNSTKISCEKSAENEKGVACSITVVGKTKPYTTGYGLITLRSAERLAVSGAIETMKDMYALSYMNHSSTGCFPNSTTVGIAKTNFYTTKVEKFWPTGVDKAAATSGDYSKISMSSSAKDPATSSDSKDCH